VSFSSKCCLFQSFTLGDALQKITLDDLKAWHDEYRKVGIRVLASFQGNLTKENAIELTKLVSHTLSLPVAPIEHIIQNDFCLAPEGLTKLCFPRMGDDVNNAVIVSLTNTVREHCKYDVDNVYVNLLNNFVQPLCFNELRTKQQLGYIVSTLCSSGSLLDAILFIVQSDTYDPEYITERINEFRASVLKFVEEITEEDFKGFVESYITTTSIKDRSIGQNSSRYWDEMLVGDLEFHLNEKLVALAKQCTREGFIAYAKKYLPVDAPGKREFVLQIWGGFQNQAEADAAGAKITLSSYEEALQKSPFPVPVCIPHKILQRELLNPPK